jgi:hypothetical protein
MAKEFLRIVCPCCGSMPYPGQVDAAVEKYPVAQVRVIVMRVGGKKPVTAVEGEPYKKIGRGKAPGSIEYEDVTNQHLDLVAKYRDHFLERVAQLKNQT